MVCSTLYLAALSLDTKVEPVSHDNAQNIPHTVFQNNPHKKAEMNKVTFYKPIRTQQLLCSIFCACRGVYPTAFTELLLSFMFTPSHGICTCKKGYPKAFNARTRARGVFNREKLYGYI